MYMYNFCMLILFLVPDAAPGNFKVSSSSSLSLDISWDAIPADKQNGKLLGYYIYYKIDGSATESNKTVGPDKLSDQLTGLEFATYVVRMVGYTAVGVGPSTTSMKKQPNEGGKGTILFKFICCLMHNFIFVCRLLGSVIHINYFSLINQSHNNTRPCTQSEHASCNYTYVYEEKPDKIQLNCIDSTQH